MSDSTERARNAANALWFEDLHVNGGVCRGCGATVPNTWDFTGVVHGRPLRPWRDECPWNATVRVFAALLDEVRAETVKELAHKVVAAQARLERIGFEKGARAQWNAGDWRAGAPLVSAPERTEP